MRDQADHVWLMALMFLTPVCSVELMDDRSSSSCTTAPSLTLCASQSGIFKLDTLIKIRRAGKGFTILHQIFECLENQQPGEEII